MSNTESQKKKFLTKRKILVIVSAVIIIILLLLLHRCTNSSGPGYETGDETRQHPALDTSQGEYEEESQEPVDPSKNITLPGWVTLTIAADTTNIKKGIDFYNPDANEGYYYLTFELLVDIEGDGNYVSIYQSGLVEAGKHIQKITLSRSLSAGTYNARVFIQPYKIDDLDVPLNNGNVDIELIVK